MRPRGNAVTKRAKTPAASKDPATAVDPPYRILIVEDDRSQALFAESVLNGAGMETRWVAQAAEVMPLVGTFDPDLVLMDLHLPEGSGTELTAQIRTAPAHAHLPIVFLTGDQDPETEYQALDSGADDFLSKPIRPRHLISAVQNRVKRARAARLRTAGETERDPATGLLRRDQLQARLADTRGAMMVEVQNLGALQDRFGYAGVEALLRAAGRRLSELAPEAARMNDNSFMVLSQDADEGALAAAARALRDGLAQPIEHNEMSLRLRAAVAWLRVPAAPGSAQELVQALEPGLRRARTEPSGIAGPQAAPAQDTVQGSPLREALEGDRLELAFQPIVSVSGGDESQFQALLRTRDEDGRQRSAGELLASADAAGLMGEVDRWVATHAIALLRADSGPHPPGRLFITQSPQAIAADPRGEWLRGALAENGIAEGALVIDVRLEDALVHGVAFAEFCEALAPHGVAFCLSRYLHGSDAAVLLKQLPLAYLRLASHYSLETSADVQQELRGVIHDAHESGLRVIGAQVENPSVAASLWMSGIDYIQGNLVQGVGKDLDFDFHHSVL